MASGFMEAESRLVPGRLDALQAAWFLGFEPHEIPILIAAGLLKPLGHPARNATKFASSDKFVFLDRSRWS